MNKKLLTICLVVVLVLSVICIVACKDNTADRLREVSMALSRDYSKVELAVTTSSSEAELKANYVITKSNDLTNISYEVDRLNGFDIDGDVPSEFKSTVKGSAVFNGSSIVSIDGEQLNEQLLIDVKDTTMTFRMSFFEKIVLSQNGFSASVKNPQGFLNDDEFAGTDMSVKVTMSQSYLARIFIEYSLNGSTVEMEYLFTR